MPGTTTRGARYRNRRPRARYLTRCVESYQGIDWPPLTRKIDPVANFDASLMR